MTLARKGDFLRNVQFGKFSKGNNQNRRRWRQLEYGTVGTSNQKIYIQNEADHLNLWTNT